MLLPLKHSLFSLSWDLQSFPSCTRLPNGLGDLSWPFKHLQGVLPDKLCSPQWLTSFHHWCKQFCTAQQYHLVDNTRDTSGYPCYHLISLHATFLGNWNKTSVVTFMQKSKLFCLSCSQGKFYSWLIQDPLGCGVVGNVDHINNKPVINRGTGSLLASFQKAVWGELVGKATVFPTLAVATNNKRLTEQG